jgi:DNA-binding LacI/PurR family transcriptional regulator
VRLGHRRVAFISPFEDSEFSQARAAGLRTVLERAGGELKVVDVTIRTGPMWDEIYADKEYQLFRRAVTRFETRTRGEYDQPEGVFPDNVVSHHMVSQFMKRHMRPYLDRIVEERAVSALVGVNDLTGLIIHSYMRGRGIGVPSMFSVASFDDTSEAFGVGLTSYNFHVPAIVHAMFEHVVNPARRRPGQTPVVEIAGTVMARESVGPATTPQAARA